MASHDNAAQQVPMLSSLDTAESCSEGNVAPKEMLKGLHPAQAGTGRHKCAICAWHEGFEAGRQYALRHLVERETMQARASEH